MPAIRSLLLLAAIAAVPAGAQPAMGVLAGTLLGQDSLGVEFPLGARRVRFVGSDSLTATTDLHGHFVLRVPAGERIVRFHGPGRSVVEERVSVSPGDTAHLTLRVPMSGFVYGREDPNRMDGWRTPGEMELAAEALSWDRERELPGRRELWIWASYALFSPGRFTRLVHEGGVVRGEVVEYWPLDPFNPWLDFRLRRLENEDSCDTLAIGRARVVDQPLPESDRYCTSQTDRECRHPQSVGIVVCRVRLEEEPDWSAVMSDLERFDVWTLPDESALPPEPWVPTDGWSIVVREMRDSNSRWYAYSNPYEGLSVHHASARAIAETLSALGGVNAPTDGD